MKGNEKKMDYSRKAKLVEKLENENKRDKKK